MFFLGVHRPQWLAESVVPLFVSRRVLAGRKRLPVASCDWVLDSGGFTELNLHGRWMLSHTDYAAEVQRYQAEIGRLVWAAPMDWMCEPSVIQKTGLSVVEHQRLTILNFKRLRSLCGPVIAPVVQGWTQDDYKRHVWDYYAEGYPLDDAPVVGVGSICRRGQDDKIVGILDALAAFGLRLHAFGVRSEAMERAADCLTSADSMAWSYAARRDAQRPGFVSCDPSVRKSCANCLHAALDWRLQQLARLDQQRIGVAA
jgi:hypothetical protein